MEKDIKRYDELQKEEKRLEEQCEKLKKQNKHN